ncbi:linear amide C-N hydrolase [Kurthia zopfii]|uniref:linear amide C-N hydrolase n=1 Tax=Kurthia zopfii TaxID=1650 RepID=UPI000F6D19A2|nr:choloylglycine hydrolase family protein [Kurthia zopfii]VEI05868.1 Penicillin V acylase and related amidases [Kurthia zopfii]
MCTSITLNSTDQKYLLARTMDFSFNLEPEMVVFPRESALNFDLADSLQQHYAFAGLAKDIGSYYIADGINEFGLTGAALYFEGCAHYAKKSTEDQVEIAPHEVIMWMLAQYKSVDEVKTAFHQIKVVEKPLEFLGTVPPLHWVFSDEQGNSIIVEIMEDGLHIEENNLGVLTNSPDYKWHMTNVRNYIGLDPHQVEPRTILGQEFKPFGQGSGTFGLPGDYTPPSRFIKTLYNKISSKKSANADEMVLSAMHILNGVDIPKGNVITNRQTIDFTQYTSYMVNNDRSYFYRMHDSLNIIRVNLLDHDLDGNNVIIL